MRQLTGLQRDRSTCHPCTLRPAELLTYHDSTIQRRLRDERCDGRKSIVLQLRHERWGHLVTEGVVQPSVEAGIQP